MHSAENESAGYYLPHTKIASSKNTYHLLKLSRMNFSAISFTLMKFGQKSDKGGRGYCWVTTGSLANHKGESLQAAASVAKKRSTALGEKHGLD